MTDNSRSRLPTIDERLEMAWATEAYHMPCSNIRTRLPAVDFIRDANYHISRGRHWA